MRDDEQDDGLVSGGGLRIGLEDWICRFKNWVPMRGLRSCNLQRGTRNVRSSFVLWVAAYQIYSHLFHAWHYEHRRWKECCWL